MRQLACAIFNCPGKLQEIPNLDMGLFSLVLVYSAGAWVVAMFVILLSVYLERRGAGGFPRNGPKSHPYILSHTVACHLNGLTSTNMGSLEEPW